MTPSTAKDVDNCGSALFGSPSWSGNITRGEVSRNPFRGPFGKASTADFVDDNSSPPYNSYTIGAGIPSTFKEGIAV